MPHCTHFPRCNRGADCQYPHVHVAHDARVCPNFGKLGWCELGLACPDRHVRECPEFSEKGTCETKGCRLPHIIRRKQPDADDAESAQADELQDHSLHGLEPASALGKRHRSDLSRTLTESVPTMPITISDVGLKRRKYDIVQANADFVTFDLDDDDGNFDHDTDDGVNSDVDDVDTSSDSAHQSASEYLE